MGAGARRCADTLLTPAERVQPPDAGVDPTFPAELLPMIDDAQRTSDAPVVVDVPATVPPPATRIVLTGSPRAGKTDRANAMGAEIGIEARHTDVTIPLGWHEASDEVATWFDAPGPWIIEGVCSPRALRKWLAAHPDGKPCDVVLLLEQPVIELSKGQESMRKGTATIFAGIRAELEARGVEIRTS